MVVSGGIAWSWINKTLDLIYCISCSYWLIYTVRYAEYHCSSNLTTERIAPRMSRLVEQAAAGCIFWRFATCIWSRNWCWFGSDQSTATVRNVFAYKQLVVVEVCPPKLVLTSTNDTQKIPMSHFYPWVNCRWSLLLLVDLVIGLLGIWWICASSSCGGPPVPGHTVHPILSQGT